MPLSHVVDAFSLSVTYLLFTVLFTLVISLLCPQPRKAGLLAAFSSKKSWMPLTLPVTPVLSPPFTPVFFLIPVVPLSPLPAAPQGWSPGSILFQEVVDAWRGERSRPLLLHTSPSYLIPSISDARPDKAIFFVVPILLLLNHDAAVMASLGTGRATSPSQ